jgi:Ser/Thr protein kinase RdoA (MazF antagonist)
LEPIEIIGQFAISDTPVSAAEYGSGHINDTYRISVQELGHPGYLIQRINHSVFPAVENLMENIAMVTSHIREKMEFQELVPSLVETHQGLLFHKEEGSYWRVSEFVDGVQSFDMPENDEQVYQGAHLFGKFLRALSDFPADRLHLTIPDFHSIKLRVTQFEESLKNADSDRLVAAIEWIERVQLNASAFIKLEEEVTSGDLPLRVTHNDTKFNNVLLGEDGQSGCVIDLDTVMPGYAFFDVGDGLRSVGALANEDESELSKIELNTVNIEAFLAGYLDATTDILTPKEKTLLPQSAAYMAFIQGVRFLTDYLNGDVYFKTDFADHNLIRAKNQLTLSRLFQNHPLTGAF